MQLTDKVLDVLLEKKVVKNAGKLYIETFGKAALLSVKGFALLSFSLFSRVDTFAEKIRNRVDEVVQRGFQSGLHL